MQAKIATASTLSNYYPLCFPRPPFAAVSLGPFTHCRVLRGHISFACRSIGGYSDGSQCSFILDFYWNMASTKLGEHGRYTPKVASSLLHASGRFLSLLFFRGKRSRYTPLSCSQSASGGPFSGLWAFSLKHGITVPSPFRGENLQL